MMMDCQATVYWATGISIYILVVRICSARNLVTALSLLGWKYNNTANKIAWITPAADMKSMRVVEIAIKCVTLT